MLDKLNRAISQGKLDPHASVRLRDYRVSDEAMEAGSNGYSDVEEVLFVEDAAILLPDVYA